MGFLLNTMPIHSFQPQILKLAVPILLFFMGNACFGQLNNPKTLEEAADRVETLIKTDSFEALHSQYLDSATIGKFVSAKQLSQTMESLSGSFGKLLLFRNQKVSNLNYSSTAVFTNDSLVFNLAFNPSLKVRGMNFKQFPGAEPLNPPYENALNKQQDFVFKSGKLTLTGALTEPANKKHNVLVVMMGGSGPTNKDGGNKPMLPLKNIADGLAANGIASLRVGKRSATHAAYIKPDSFTVMQEYVEDANAALASIAKDNRYKKAKVYFLGHSQGGTMAPVIINSNPNWAGCIMVAPASRPLAVLIREQVKFLKRQAGTSDTLSIWAGLDSLVARTATNRVLQFKKDSLMGLSPIYWNSLNQLNIAQEIKQAQKPMLALFGGADYQVNLTEENLYRQMFLSKTNCKVAHFDKLNHYMVYQEGTPNPAFYKKPGYVNESVIMEIVRFLNH